MTPIFNEKHASRTENIHMVTSILLSLKKRDIFKFEIALW